MKSSKEETAVLEIKRRTRRIKREHAIIKRVMERWARKQIIITPMMIQEIFAVDIMSAAGYYDHLYRAGVINKNGFVNGRKPVPPAGSDAPDA